MCCATRTIAGAKASAKLWNWSSVNFTGGAIGGTRASNVAWKAARDSLLIESFTASKSTVVSIAIAYPFGILVLLDLMFVANVGHTNGGRGGTVTGTTETGRPGRGISGKT